MTRALRIILSGAAGCALSIAACAPRLGAQTSAVSGRVVDAVTGAPLAGAMIDVPTRARGTVIAGARRTDPDGRFLLALDAGFHSLRISRVGYEAQRLDSVQLRAGEVTQLIIQLRTRTAVLEAVRISESSAEATTAPDRSASSSVVGTQKIQARIASSLGDHVRAVPGMDVAQTGIQQGSVVARGFNQVGSASLVTMVDHRYANLPSLRLSALTRTPEA